MQEADHLHNLPELIGKVPEDKHHYYLDTEKDIYSANIAEDEYPRCAFEPLWIELERLLQ